MDEPVQLPADTDRVLTIPNLLSVGRLLCVPLFLWLLFGRDSRVGAAALLAVLGATDWVDGFVARRFGLVSELGKVLDPTADRILLATAAIAMWADGAVPGLVFWPVIVREVAISLAVLGLAAAGAARIDVLWVGKAGAFALMFAFPFFLLAEAGLATEDLWRFLGWGCAIPGVVLSYVAAARYIQLVPSALAARGSSEGVAS
ncbi:MAG: CDP-alcohol phosphatidyltransferase family protein [Actinobacteria bacterium]|nr:CDP-alcohol phosphatidyltransferase family protein [Actinomycetota bacterium]